MDGCIHQHEVTNLCIPPPPPIFREQTTPLKLQLGCWHAHSTMKGKELPARHTCEIRERLSHGFVH